MVNRKTLEMAVTAIAGVTGALAWYNSCKICESIKDDDATSVAIRKATGSIIHSILYGCCVKVSWDLYNK